MITIEKNEYGFKEFAKLILEVDLGLFILYSIPIYYLLGGSRLLAILSATLLTTVNFLIGYFIIAKYFYESINFIMKVVFGAMILRIMALLIVVIIFILFIKIDQNSFIIGLFISYIYKSVIEIYFINKKSFRR